jgi:HAMP domain-containing protein
MHPSTVSRLVDEIAPRVRGAQVVAAYAPGDGCLIAELSAELSSDGKLFLGICTIKALPLIFLSDEPRSVPSPRDEQRGGVVRELGGATVVSLATADEAVAELAFRKTLVTGRVVDRVLSIDLGRRPRVTVRETGTPRGVAATAGGAAGGEASIEAAPGGGGPTVAWRHDSAGRVHVRISTSDAPADAEGSRRFGSVTEAAAFAFGEFWAPLSLETRRSAVGRRIATALRRKRRAIKKVRAELLGAADADDQRRRAHLLLTRQSEIRRGARRVELRDYDGTTPVVIELDPALTASQNAEALFRRARKAARRTEAAPRRLAELEEDEKRLLGLAESVGRATADEITNLESEFPAPAARRGRSAEGGIRARYRTYTVAGGWEVLVGKSNRDNDVLTHRIARPSDLWFHVRQAPGSHVILRRHGRKAEPDRQAILEAAAIAAFHSKAGRSTKVPVCYTERRHVRKPRGARPGLAVVSREKVVLVEPKLPGT